MKLVEAFVQLRVNSTGAKEEAREEARGVAEEMTKTFAQFFSAAVVIKGLKDATDAASRLEQAVGGTEAIFGSASASIDQFASTSAQSLGISEAAFREVTSQIGGLLNGLGFTQTESAKTSVELARLGADLAATFGGQPEEAVQALGAALRGEFNPLENFGVSLRVSQINLKAVELGLAETTTQVDGNARAQAALALITEQSANAIGQNAREADTAAGKTARLAASFEDAKAKLGEQLIPALLFGVDVLGAMIDGFSGLPGPVQLAIVAIGGIAAVAGPVGKAIDAMSKLEDAIGKIPVSTQVAFTAAVVAVGLAVVAYQAYTKKAREAEARTNEVSTALSAGRDRLAEYAQEANETTSTVDDLAVAQRALSDALLEGDDGEKIVQALGTIGALAEDTASIIIEIGNEPVAAMQRYLEAAGLSADVSERLARVINDTDTALQDNLGIDKFAAAFSTLAKSGEVATDGFAEIPDSVRPVILALEELQDQSQKTKFADLATQFLNAEVAADSSSASLVAQAEAITGVSRNSEDAFVVFEKYGELLAQIDGSTTDTALSAADLEEGLVDVANSGEEAAEELREVDDSALDAADSFDALDTAASLLRDAFDKLIGRNVDLDAAYSDVFDGAKAVTDAFAENQATLDPLTEAGRANRDAVRDQVDALLDLGIGLVETGSSNDEAAATVLGLRDSLIKQMIQAGLTREAAEEYIAQLGLTPENVETSIELANVEASKLRIQGHIDELGEIPDDIATEIEALIDEGQYAEAERRLAALERVREVRVRVLSQGASTFVPQVNVGTIRNAQGGYYDQPALSTLVEDGDPEVVLPLAKPERLDALLADPRSRAPIAASLARSGGAIESGGSSERHLHMHNHGQPVSYHDVSLALEASELTSVV